MNQLNRINIDQDTFERILLAWNKNQQVRLHLDRKLNLNRTNLVMNPNKVDQLSHVVELH